MHYIYTTSDAMTRAALFRTAGFTEQLVQPLPGRDRGRFGHDVVGFHDPDKSYTAMDLYTCLTMHNLC